MANFENSKVMKEITEIIQIMYRNGWDERNGGNISYILGDTEVEEYKDEFIQDKLRPLNLELPKLNNKYLVITSSGIYFKNILKCVPESFGVIKVLDNGKNYRIVWGFENNRRPTSELQSHLLGHESKMSVNPLNKVIMHSHPTNLIAMSFIHDLDENKFTKTLWKMMTECIVVFPEGLGILPWMVCGDGPIGPKTADKLKEYRAVLWPMHGIFSSGNDIDDAFGLLETIEKAAEVFVKIQGRDRVNEITDEDLARLAQSFNVNPKPGVLG